MNYKEVLELKKSLEIELKNRSMIFDCDGKERLALWFDLPIDTYYLYSFDDYQIAKSRMSDEVELMRQYSKMLPTDFSTTPYLEWKLEFRVWAIVNNIETPKPFVINS